MPLAQQNIHLQAQLHPLQGVFVIEAGILQSVVNHHAILLDNESAEQKQNKNLSSVIVEILLIIPTEIFDFN